MKLPRHIKRFVEEELRQYRIHKINLEHLMGEKDDIYNRTRQPTAEPVRGSHPGDPTYTAAVMLEKTEGLIRYYETRIAKIDLGLSMCTDAERELLEYRYMSAYEPTDEEAIIYLRFGNRNKYFSTRDRGLVKIARAFGLWGI